MRAPHPTEPSPWAPAALVQRTEAVRRWDYNDGATGLFVYLRSIPWSDWDLVQWDHGNVSQLTGRRTI